MPKIDEILNSGLTADQTIAALREKTVIVPAWRGAKGLEREYNPDKHPVMDKGKYPDRISDGQIREVTRIPLDFQRLAVDRMTSILTATPIKHIYQPENERQKEVGRILDKIFDATYFNTLNNDRLKALFAACEVMTLWYAVDEPTARYGFDSPLKLRRRVFTPILGDDLYPLFDENGDMIAMSVGYTRKVGRKRVQYFDAYTAERHLQWSTDGGSWEKAVDEPITLGKIPCVYMSRPEPIWKKSSNLVSELEWTLSRNGNYIADNSKPLLAVCADEMIAYGNEKDSNHESRSVAQFPAGASVNYVTWQQATESMKFHTDTLRSLFFTQLQLPDWSYEKMSQLAMSGEAMQQLFIDARMKGEAEADHLREPFDREVNVVKAFLKIMLPDEYASDIDALPVTVDFQPFSITAQKDTIDELLAANGGKPVASQRETIERLGWSNDVDQTMREITEENAADALNPTY
ncbi:MAG: phage portal protein [Bacteroidales bacterium]|nr:phage portal protein [Bacteroidales bacterium]